MVILASHRSDADAPNPSQAAESLADLEALTLSNNPILHRLQQEAAALQARTAYIGELPDPTISSIIYTPPMNFEPDRQLAEFQLMQVIPWLGRLNAETQQVCMEALAAENMVRAERLRIIGDLRAAWYSLYALGKQIETTKADQEQLDSLIKTANARVKTGSAQPGDVLMATLELAALQDQVISYRRQIISTVAETNKIVGRDSGVPIAPPAEIDSKLPNWNHDMLKQLAIASQPEMNAARIRAAAKRWGIEVAHLRRRPDLTFGVGWVPMDAPNAISPNAGRDSFTLGITASLPVYRRKYDAMAVEAMREHAAAHASEDEIALRLDAMLRDLWEQARAGRESIELYEKTILPQAKQTYEANLKSLVNNSVAFDRVIRDYRTVLNLELTYRKAQGQLATTLARIRQTVGVDLK